MVGNALADAWAWLSVFVVMALWFVWALDARNGYHALLHLGGASLAVLVGGARRAIVTFGALARLFNGREDARPLAREPARVPLLPARRDAWWRGSSAS